MKTSSNVSGQKLLNRGLDRGVSQGIFKATTQESTVLHHIITMYTVPDHGKKLGALFRATEKYDFLFRFWGNVAGL